MRAICLVFAIICALGFTACKKAGIPEAVPSFLEAYKSPNDRSVCSVSNDEMGFRDELYYRYNVYATDP